MLCTCCELYILADMAFMCDLCKSFFCEKCSRLKPSELAAMKLPSTKLMFWCYRCKNEAYITIDLTTIDPIAEVEIDDGEPGYLYIALKNKATNTATKRTSGPSEAANIVQHPVEKKRKLDCDGTSSGAVANSITLRNTKDKDLTACWGYLDSLADEVMRKASSESTTRWEAVSKVAEMKINIEKCLTEAKMKIIALPKPSEAKSFGELKELRQRVVGIVRDAVGDCLKPPEERRSCSAATSEERPSCSAATSKERPSCSSTTSRNKTVTGRDRSKNGSSGRRADRGANRDRISVFEDRLDEARDLIALRKLAVDRHMSKRGLNEAERMAYYDLVVRNDFIILDEILAGEEVDDV